MDGNKLYKQYQPLIKKASYFYARKWGMESFEVESQALEIFCKALNTHNPELGSFGTYLHSELRGLNRFCKLFVLNHGSSYEGATEVLSKGYSPEVFINLKEAILTELSETAQEIVLGILEGELIECGDYKHTFTTSNVSSKMHLKRREADFYIREVRNWWNSYITEAGY